MEPSPATRPQRDLPHHDGQTQNDRQTAENASSEPCYIDDVSACTVAEKVTAATVVDRLMETTADVHENNSTAMRATDENNPTTVTAADENNPTAVTAADEEVTAAVAVPATLQVTTEEQAVTTETRAPEVSFVRKFKRFKFFFFISSLNY